MIRTIVCGRISKNKNKLTFKKKKNDFPNVRLNDVHDNNNNNSNVQVQHRL